MMTPQEVSEHAFSKASFGGYNMAMVDEFLDVLTGDYTTLYKENAVLKSKMKVLVDKVEEYRSTEDAMRKALLTAQRMADELIAEAEAKRDELLSLAEAKARDRVAMLQRDVEHEQMRLAAAQKSTAEYIEQLKGLYQHEMEYLGSLGKMAPPAARQEDGVEAAAQDIEASVERIVGQGTHEPPADPEEDTVDLGPAKAAGPAPAAPTSDGGLYAELLELNLQRKQSGDTAVPAAPEEGPEEEYAPTRRIDFSNLQFGKDYEIR